MKVLSLLCNRYDVREGGAQRRPISELVWVEESKVSKASPNIVNLMESEWLCFTTL